MTQRITVVDAFTSEPFRGNPASVCLLNEDRDEDWMQAVAREMSHSETAFLRPRADGWSLRWFTPAREVDLCGHATLASAHVLAEEGVLEAGEAARFNTRGGVLTARLLDGWIELDFPATPVNLESVPELEKVIGAPAIATGTTLYDAVIQVEDESRLRSLAPDFAALRVFEARGVIATAAADPGRPYDFVSRYFAPSYGIDEDPVTGSAHCALAPYWAERLGRTELTGFQCSPRGGTVRTVLTGDRVRLQGQAVTVLRCELVALNAPKASGTPASRA